MFSAVHCFWYNELRFHRTKSYISLQNSQTTYKVLNLEISTENGMHVKTNVQNNGMTIKLQQKYFKVNYYSYKFSLEQRCIQFA